MAFKMKGFPYSGTSPIKGRIRGWDEETQKHNTAHDLHDAGKGPDPHEGETGPNADMAFKMKGSPMYRNFGIGSPIQQKDCFEGFKGSCRLNLWDRMKSNRRWANFKYNLRKGLKGIGEGLKDAGDWTGITDFDKDGRWWQGRDDQTSWGSGRNLRDKPIRNNPPDQGGGGEEPEYITLQDQIWEQQYEQDESGGEKRLS